MLALTMMMMQTPNLQTSSCKTISREWLGLQGAWRSHGWSCTFEAETASRTTKIAAMICKVRKRRALAFGSLGQTFLETNVRA